MYAIIFTATYYGALLAISLRYFVASFQGTLPWSICKEEWGSECINSARNVHRNISGTGRYSATEYYF